MDRNQLIEIKNQMISCAIKFIALMIKCININIMLMVLHILCSAEKKYKQMFKKFGSIVQSTSEKLKSWKTFISWRTFQFIKIDIERRKRFKPRRKKCEISTLGVFVTANRHCLCLCVFIYAVKNCTVTFWHIFKAWRGERDLNNNQIKDRFTI